MPKRAAGAIITGIVLERDQAAPLHRQLYESVRAAILNRRLLPGTRLPSSRVLARELGVSRNTVAEAFLQLFGEGYIEGRVGAGTYVTRTLPDDLLRLDSPMRSASPPLPANRSLSRRFETQKEAMPAPLQSRLGDVQVNQAFMAGVPALDAFPHALWGKLVAWHGRDLQARWRGYQHPAGYLPLREAIASYLATARGVNCTAEQVVVVAGAKQGLALAAHVLLDPGEAVWMEEPGYFGAKGVLLGAGARLVPIPVDSEGLNVETGRTRCPEARMAFITPSHQMPLGVTMSLTRRLELLEWARQAQAWIIEDDYDSEYRYVGRPLAALQGLDTNGRVLYSGTFSKVLFPALRLGYMVVPPDLVNAFITARLFTDTHSPLLEQMVLAEFMQEGHFARHLRRMRALYAERQAALVEAAQRELAGKLEVLPAETGMHLVGWLPPETDDEEIARKAAALGVTVFPLSQTYMERPKRSGLVLGYAGVSIPKIKEGVHRLAQAFSQI